MSDEQERPANLAHRDDLPFEVAEAMVAAFQEQFPGYKIVFAGDAPTDQELPPGLIEEAQRMDHAIDVSAATGTCLDCGAKVPTEWPPPDEKLAEGWSKYGVPGSEQFFLVCPACTEATPNIDLDQ